jgi:predicted ATPase
MAITNIKVSNFKSFKDLDLNLGRFNVVIGANASGKSNFVEIFRFLKTLERENLADAISLHDGSGSILNKKIGSSEPLQMRATFDRQEESGEVSYVHVYETIYDFSLQFEGAQDLAIVKDDHFAQKMRIEAGNGPTEMTVDTLMSDGSRKVEIGPRDLVDRIKDERVPLNNPRLLRFYKQMCGLANIVERFKTNELLVRPDFLGFVGPLDSLFGGIGVYDIDPRAVKRLQGKAGRLSLEERGENLDLVLRNLLADKEKRRKFHNLLRYMLPFAVEVGVEDLGTSLLLKLREEYYEDSLLANLLADGTADVVALVVALFFEDKDVAIIEEPERNIHPRLISGLVELMKDAARTKQVIVTTHSPEFVKHAGLESLLLISRDKEGFSTISRPAEKETVKIFLQNDLGLDDLFVQDVLAAP